MALKYGSVCSGIEAASVAWAPLGWHASFFSEIESFPRAVLSHRYPNTPLHGDFTTIQAGDYEPIDLLVGGTPCQDFSVAGKRAGLDGSRGNLTLEYARLARRLRPRWLVWENVPGLFSANDGRDFGAVLACFAGFADGTIYATPQDGWRNAGIVPAAPGGYGLAWRVLDAQFAGVPQRRRRIFLVGYSGDWRRAAAVLFERHSLQGNPPPRRETGASSAVGALGGTSPGGGWRFGADEAAAGQLIPETVGALAARSGRNGGASNQEADAGQVIAFGGSANCAETDVSTAVSAHPGGYRLDAETETFITHALRADSFDASEDGTGRGTPLVPCSYSPEVSAPLMARSSRGGGQVNSPGYQADEQLIAFDSKASGRNGFGVGEMAPTLRAMGHKDSHSNAGGQIAVAVSVSQNSNGFAWEGEVAATLQTSQQTGQGNQFDGLRTQSGVRRLTPRECERLQGFPDDHTLIRFNGKAAADGPRYKALGNSMAVPVMRWIGERIQLVEGIQQDRQEAA